jgi:sporulation protein YlmC with PRC-barrel domain
MKPTMGTSTRSLRLGRPVRSRDAKWVGRVERLVFIPESGVLREFVLHQGRIRVHEWFVDQRLIQNIGHDGTVTLRLSASEIEGLPSYLRANHIEMLPGLMGGAGLPHLRQSHGSVPIDAVIFDRHSRIEDFNGHRIGVLSGLMVSSEGVVSDFEAFTNHGEHNVSLIPMDFVASVRHDRIRLSQTGVDIDRRTSE